MFTELDRTFAMMAISEARKCTSESGKVSPLVGAIAVKEGALLATAYRGELEPGEHAEFTLLEKKLKASSLTGATIYTTLEPCTKRNHPKLCCAARLIERRVARVVIGVLDPNLSICGKGIRQLQDRNIEVELFPPDLVNQLEELNRDFRRAQETPRKRRPKLNAGRSETFLSAEKLAAMSPVEMHARDMLYYVPDGWAQALRLWGAQGQNCRAREVVVSYEHVPLKYPTELLRQAEAAIEKRRAEAALRGAKFFNGPNTRLLSWSANPMDGPSVARERDTVHLKLGPVGWYDYTGLNDAFRVEREEAAVLPMYRHYVGFDALIRDRSVSASKLSNILDTATTIVTKDRFAGYQLRSGKVSTQADRITSAVAENINRWMDDADPSNPLALFNRNSGSAETTEADGTYAPNGVPHPFAAVLRGLAAEISPLVADRIHPDCIRLTGLSFDLEVMHPDALFVVFVDATRADIEEDRALSPGDEHDEGVLRFVPATLASAETRELVLRPEWIAAGLASFIRALEVIDAGCREGNRSFDQVFAQFVRDPRRTRGSGS